MQVSELYPYTCSLIHDIFIDADALAGVVNLIASARSTTAKITEYLISNKHIRKIDFIDQAAVGRIISSTAAKHLKPVLIELGGKYPTIVLDDADILKVAEICTKGAFLHYGQNCFSIERIIV